MVLDHTRVLGKTAEYKRSSEICRIENVPEIVPGRGSENDAVLSADISCRILNVKSTTLLAVKRLRWSAGERAVYLDFRPARWTPGSVFLIPENEDGFVAKCGRKHHTIDQLHPVRMSARTEPLFR